MDFSKQKIINYPVTSNKIIDKQSDENKYKWSKSIKSTKNLESESITKLCNSGIKMKKAFTILDTKIVDMENEDYDWTDSDDDDKYNSHFQFEETYWFQGVHQTTVVIPKKIFMFNQTFEQIIE